MNPSILNQQSSSAWASYQRMRVRLAGRLNQILSGAAGLSESDYEVLSVLTESQAEYVRALELRCGLEWEKSRLSHQLRRMEQRGLLTREDCAEDSRGSVVKITTAGREAVTEAKRIHDEAVDALVFARLTSEQSQQLQEISDLILEGLTEPHRA